MGGKRIGVVSEEENEVRGWVVRRGRYRGGDARREGG